MKKFSFIFFFFVGLAFAASASAAVSCTSVSSDLSYGMSGSSVLMLQNFLSAEGYLAATPNGNFGPATLAAVELFQTNHNISSTGYVGSLTRAAIASNSCVATTPTQTTTATPEPAVSPSAITSPEPGETLTLGQQYTIHWNASNAANGYRLLLEDPTGLPMGFITPNAQSGGSFNWQIGNVLTTNTGSYQSVQPGSYEIHLEPVAGGSDIYSGEFNIVAPNVTLQSIMPQSVPNDNATAVVVYGAGFANGASVHLDNYIGVTTLYTSTDGHIMVFSVPSTVIPGIHQVSITNGYGSSSDALNLTVTAH